MHGMCLIQTHTRPMYTVPWYVVSIAFRHPLTGSHFSTKQVRLHTPPQFLPKVPGGQGESHKSPKNPGLHAGRT